MSQGSSNACLVTRFGIPFHLVTCTAASFKRLRGANERSFRRGFRFHLHPTVPFLANYERFQPVLRP